MYSEWVVNQHRDSLASYIGHHNLVEFFAIAENESKARVKFKFLQVSTIMGQLCFTIKNFPYPQKMLQPCGFPHEKQEED